jgi:octaprenyl-diphosphate synthase
LRHGQETVSARYGRDVAVLLGDALFAHALKLATDFPTVEVCREVAQATRRVCAGEISQTLQRGNDELSLDAYRRIIDLKTAELFRVSCFLGARFHAGAPAGYPEAAARFGQHLGRAYQIFDDIADLVGDEGTIGKTLGTDLASGKLTLPLILWRQREGVEVIRQRLASESAPEIVRALQNEGLIDAAAAQFQVEVTSAEEALSPHRDLEAVGRLIHLVELVHGLFGKLDRGRP